jgi:hypothetical protein
VYAQYTAAYNVTITHSVSPSQGDNTFASSLVLPSNAITLQVIPATELFVVFGKSPMYIEEGGRQNSSYTISFSAIPPAVQTVTITAYASASQPLIWINDTLNTFSFTTQLEGSQVYPISVWSQIDAEDFGNSFLVSLAHTITGDLSWRNSEPFPLVPASGVVDLIVFDKNSTCRRTCPGGTYLNFSEASVDCLQCSEGHYCPGNCDLETPCPTGYGANASSVSCSICWPGTAAIDGKCVACQPGSFTASYGKTSCDLCPADSRADYYGASRCEWCRVSRYDMLECDHCGYTKDVNATIPPYCRKCKVGEYINVSGPVDDFCRPCVAGTYSTNDNSTACTQCTTGK